MSESQAGNPFGANRQLRILGNDAEFLLPFERVLAILVPALVELAFEFVDPFLRRVVRSVRGAGRDVKKERPPRRDAFRLANPRDRLIGDIGREVIVRVGRPRDEIAVLVEDGIPMVHVAGVEAVEVVEAQAVGPAVERAGRARLPGRRVVVLADPGGHVAVLTEDFADGAAASRKNADVAVVAGGELRDAGKRRRVMVAAGYERRARRAAERGRVKVVVAKAFRGQLVHRRRGDAAAERAVLTEPAIVDQDEQDVRRALRAPAPVCGNCARIGFEICAADLAGEMKIGPRKDRRSPFAAIVSRLPVDVLCHDVLRAVRPEAECD